MADYLTFIINTKNSWTINQTYAYLCILILQVAGYLNLMANSIDNFTHGLAVGGSFLISPRVGALTTFAILVHEVPHEVGDFAILLRAGFTRWDAAKAQLCTASAGIVGALTAVAFSGAGSTMGKHMSFGLLMYSYNIF